jgi:CspA family cold shock protein
MILIVVLRSFARAARVGPPDENLAARHGACPAFDIPCARSHSNDGHLDLQPCAARKGFGFVIPDGGGEALFVHRSVLAQAGLSQLREGTRVRIRVGQGKKGLQVSELKLA